jgi:hypothetical protein
MTLKWINSTGNRLSVGCDVPMKDSLNVDRNVKLVTTVLFTKGPPQR